MDATSLTIGLKDQRIQLFRDGVWAAEVEVDWKQSRCRHLPSRVAESKALLDELLVVLQCKCLLLSPDKFNRKEGMVNSVRTDDAIPLFLSDGKQSLTALVTDVSDEILALARSQGKAILVSYRNLHMTPGNPIPKLMGMRVVNVSEFPMGWAQVDQVPMIDLLPNEGKTHADLPENFKLAVGAV